MLKRIREDIRSVFDRDPAATGWLEVLLCTPGLHALWAHRVCHRLYRRGLRLLPRLVSQIVRLATGVEIHPGASIGRSFFIDHGTGVVIGETTVIGDNVTIFQGVTLGGTGKEHGKRHPSLEDNVVVGTGAKVLGDIRVGRNSRVGANSVVIRDVPPDCTVVGIPGRVVSNDGRRTAASTLDHDQLPDPILIKLGELQRAIHLMEQQHVVQSTGDHYQI